MTPPFSVGRSARRWFVLVATSLLTAACGDPSTAADLAQPGDAALARQVRNTTSTIQVNVSGLPSGTVASINVTGPNGYARTLIGTTTLTGLINGSYTFTAASVIASGSTYATSPTTNTVSVNKGATATTSFVYGVVVTTGTLGVSITMPDATPAAVTVTGPNGYSSTLTTTASLTQLAPGTYTIAAASVTSALGVSLMPTPTSQTATVTAGATASAAVAYAAINVTPTPGLNLQILGMYLTQSVQTMNGGVALVSGRDGVLRVFALANAVNTARPSVRARFFQNGTLVATLSVAAPASSVPTSVNEGSMTSSWNIVVPGALLQPGLSVLADVDPDNAVAEDLETDNLFPVSGAPRALDVRFVPALAVRFVPVQQGNGLLGNVSDANAAAFLTRTRDIHPLNAVTSTTRAVYTTTLNLSSDGANWSPLLGELRALRTADGASQNYYGVAQVTYSSGVAGIGYIGAPVSMGWDYLPSAGEVMAHELGHNWARQHAPCGGVGGPDANYPYAGGSIGVFGFNVRLNQLLSSSTADLMGYCSPTWISDYTYLGVMSYRGTSTTATTITSASVQPSLLVWGRIDADGAIELEPAVRLTGRSVLPARAGNYTLDATDAAGNTIFSVSFDPDQVADESNTLEDEHFAFMIPVNEAAQARLATLRVRGKGRAAERTTRGSQAALDAAASAAAVRANGVGRARVQWNATAYPLVVVRDATSGDVLSFARGGSADVAASGSDVEVVFSDGVRSASRKVKVSGR
ncbi:hypothetical protein [Gemmatimonas sp.]|uniref:hypothetical protein n=1 Tax=Gemmatimonas sp. TaxID=1962908 RepID=UPI00286D53EA|nr:hypothetical protein [Gemmatimonas sp.]